MADRELRGRPADAVAGPYAASSPPTNRTGSRTPAREAGACPGPVAMSATSSPWPRRMRWSTATRTGSPSGASSPPARRSAASFTASTRAAARRRSELPRADLDGSPRSRSLSSCRAISWRSSPEAPPRPDRARRGRRLDGRPGIGPVCEDVDASQASPVPTMKITAMSSSPIVGTSAGPTLVVEVSAVQHPVWDARGGYASPCLARPRLLRSGADGWLMIRFHRV